MIFGQVTHKIIYFVAVKYHDSKYEGIGVAVNVSSVEITEFDNGHIQGSEVMR